MRVREIRASYDQMASVFQAATQFVDGAILIDEFDDVIFDDVLRTHPIWDRITKREAPGDTTGGFDQTAIGDARSADPRVLGFTATSPSRSARTRKNIKAVVMNRQFGIFDRSVGMQQGRPFSDLTDKDVRDMVAASFRKWNLEFYDGDEGLDATEFEGLEKLLVGDIKTIGATVSIVKELDNIIIDMVNTSDKDVRPTALYVNAKVVQMIAREFNKVGEKLFTIKVPLRGNNFMEVTVFPSSAGMLPLIVDPFNKVQAGTPNVFRTFVVSEDKLRWEFVRILGSPSPDPRTFEISLQNDLDLQFSTVMFGAIELLGGTAHHKHVDVEFRDTPVDPTA